VDEVGERVVHPDAQVVVLRVPTLQLVLAWFSPRQLHLRLGLCFSAARTAVLLDVDELGMVDRGEREGAIAARTRVKRSSANMEKAHRRAGGLTSMASAARPLARRTC
jgi:hypothetical protein